MTNRSAFITGVTGQDGSYLTDLLLSKGYKKIHVLIRFSSTPLSKTNMKHLLGHNRVTIHFGDVTDSSSIMKAIRDMIESHQDADRFELYNLAAQSHVGMSFNCPTATFDANVKGITNILDAVIFLGVKDRCRIYQASTSEMYGKVEEVPQSETTPFHPRSPYGVSKLCAHWLVKNYRETHDIFACCGILFNHESPRRGAEFVTQKIVLNVTGGEDILELGNLDSKRDWGHAKDFVEAMWLILQQDVPREYVVATGTMTTVREFCEKVFVQACGKKLRWEGEGTEEVGIVYGEDSNDVVKVKVNPKFYRPCEVDELLGDSTLVQSIGWKPKYNLDLLIHDMISAASS